MSEHHLEPLFDLPPLPSLEQILARVGLGVINHSGGKDSGAMGIQVTRLAAELGVLDKFAVLHNPLGILEWPGADRRLDTTDPDHQRLWVHRRGADLPARE